jgi:RND superfamily putative drug exporter
MAALARWCLRHRRTVIIFWILAFLAGGLTAGTTAGRLTFDFSLPDQPGYETARKVLANYGTEAQGAPLVLVLSADKGGRVADDAAKAAFDAVARDVPGVRVVGKTETGSDVFVTEGGRAQFAYAYYPPATSFAFTIIEDIQRAMDKATPAGLTGSVTGMDALATNEETNDDAGVLAETLLAGVGRSRSSPSSSRRCSLFLPILVAAVSILSTFLILLGITTFTDVSFIVQFLVSLIGLGVAIDYSLLIVTRWREERAHGRENHEAVVAPWRRPGIRWSSAA